MHNFTSKESLFFTSLKTETDIKRSHELNELESIIMTAQEYQDFQEMEKEITSIELQPRHDIVKEILNKIYNNNEK
ncbi:MAG: hypothetical protein IT215_00135 [Chitinophagaceae bacterium]|nr:MAG: hypothetical protein UZ11_BCD004000249 [Bacteroidetes bacterium OLB11]MCC6447081.1 hypothetical protein [Chitinophagaceae bacterium]HMN32235.1 hypothetical protein [Chitinophagaceae bacterium]